MTAIRLHIAVGHCDGCGDEAELWLDLCSACWCDQGVAPRRRRRSWLVELRRWYAATLRPSLAAWWDRTVDERAWVPALGFLGFALLVLREVRL
jgi:hypothetical protein